MDRAMTLWTLAQAMRDLQRHRILWALLGLVAPDESIADYWARLREAAAAVKSDAGPGGNQPDAPSAAASTLYMASSDEMFRLERDWAQWRAWRTYRGE